ncbi:DNA primase large subunit isoform X3 [Aphelocoma coerulescens]|uniref:DNA primase large subunit isoform X3 n=1 Tax=Aphelocoma coerulescens TaxID=39617 RepID=UPI0036052E0A
MPGVGTASTSLPAPGPPCRVWALPAPPCPPRGRHAGCGHCQHLRARPGAAMPGVGTASTSLPAPGPPCRVWALPAPPCPPRGRHAGCGHCQHLPARPGTAMPGVGTANVAPPRSRQQPMAAQEAWPCAEVGGAGGAREAGARGQAGRGRGPAGRCRAVSGGVGRCRAVSGGRERARGSPGAREMEFSSRARQKHARLVGDRREQYPHSLQFYLEPPTESISLVEFESFAVDRLKLLKVVENLGVSYVRGTDLYKTKLEVELRKLKFPYRALAEDDYEARRKDHISHFILRLAYCQSEDLRRWFLQQEMDLFRYRFNELTENLRQKFLEHINLSFEGCSYGFKKTQPHRTSEFGE